MGTSRDESLGDVIRRLRKDRGLTQEDLADRAGISQRTLSDIERGNIGLPRVENLRALASVLRVDPGELLLASGYTEQRQIANALTEQVGGSPASALTDDPEMARLLDKLLRVRLNRERVDTLESVLDRWLRFDRESGGRRDRVE